MKISLEQYNELRDRALRLKNTRDTSYTQMKRAEKMLSSKLSDLKVIKEDKITQDFAIKILKEVIDNMSKEFIASIVDLLTFAVQTIFHDENYAIEIDIKAGKLGNQALIYLIDNNTGVRTEINSVGGGLRQCVALTLQIFFIMSFDLRRIIFLDEGLSAVSDTYIETLMQFIKQLTQERDFIICSVVHDPRFIPYADKTFKMTKGKLSRVDDYIIEEDEL